MSNTEGPARTAAVGTERKLTAILATDVKGYSRLMGEDEVGTLRTLTAYRKIIDTLIEQHRGRIVGTAGDSVLAEFASIVDAVQCAVVIQTTLRAENANLPSDRKMEFRIGINLGDVMVEGEQIYGDGVNIAARMETLAEGGGICISGTVYDQIENKLSLPYEYLGEQQVKNIKKPVRVWRVLMGPEAASFTRAAGSPESGVRGPRSEIQSPKPPRVSTAYLSRSALVAVGLLIVAGIVILLYPSRSPFRIPQSTIRNQEALPFPDKPSIVVLPFVNMSGDPGQEYFSDGITEDLTTDLSRLSGLFVIASNSAFTYKGKAVNVQEVSKKLGVQYMLEGSVQKADTRVRINAQLVDATTGAHLWAERYDRELKDLFALQDEIGQKIVLALKVRLTKEEQERFRRAPTDNLEAYDFLLRGVEHAWRSTKEEMTQARQMYEKAIDLDPQYAAAYANLAFTHWWSWVWQWSQDPQTLERAFELAQKAVALDDSLAGAHMVLGNIYLWKKQHDQAIAEGERAIALDPNSGVGHFRLAETLNFAGRPAEAIGLAEKAMRLDPLHRDFYLIEAGFAYSFMGRHEEAITTLKRVLARYPNNLGAHGILAVSYSELGREEEARAEVAEMLKISPNFSLEVMRQIGPQKDPAIAERTLKALRKAGLK